MPSIEFRAGQPKPIWRSVVRARQIRDELRAALGGRCAKCRGSKQDVLSFDHIQPVGWVASAHSWHARMLEYQRAHREGNLQLLCVRCHGKKSTDDQKEIDEIRSHIETPF